MTASKSLPEVLSAVVLGPEDRAVLVYPPYMTLKELDIVRDQLRACGAEGRVFVAMGFEDIIALRATKAEGSTVGQCGDRLPPMFGRQQYAPGESVQSCHLAHGHTGMHSDGSATWTNEPSVCDSWAYLDMGTAHGSHCALAPGHDGRHRDESGRSWSDGGAAADA